MGRREAARFKVELVAAIKQIVDTDAVDSPVYTFLRLEPPTEGARPRGAAARPDVAAPEQNAKQLLDVARSEMANNHFPTARRLLQREGVKVRMDDVVTAAAAAGVALEINSQLERNDLNDSHVKLALDKAHGQKLDNYLGMLERGDVALRCADFAQRGEVDRFWTGRFTTEHGKSR